MNDIDTFAAAALPWCLEKSDKRDDASKLAYVIADEMEKHRKQYADSNGASLIDWVEHCEKHGLPIVGSI